MALVASGCSLLTLFYWCSGCGKLRTMVNPLLPSRSQAATWPAQNVQSVERYVHSLNCKPVRLDLLSRPVYTWQPVLSAPPSVLRNSRSLQGDIDEMHLVERLFAVQSARLLPRAERWR
eukprot:1311476-Pleurochrysis_carterae.AAC.1